MVSKMAVAWADGIFLLCDSRLYFRHYLAGLFRSGHLLWQCATKGSILVRRVDIHQDNSSHAGMGGHCLPVQGLGLLEAASIPECYWSRPYLRLVESLLNDVDISDKFEHTQS